MLTFVLPIIAKDLDRASILIKSLQKFFTLDYLDNFIIITPESDLEYISTWHQSHNLQCDVIVEGQICKFKHTTPGWYRQQLLKLGISKYVTSPFYLTLDADVICTKKCSLFDFVQDDRALVHLESMALHADWWNASSAILDIDKPSYGWHIGVTPAILSTNVVNRMLEHIGDWQDKLQSNLKWSEYTLYGTFVDRVFGLYHFTGQIYQRDSVWEAWEFPIWDLARSFDQTSPWYFTICQSNTGITADQIMTKVRPFL